MRRIALLLFLVLAGPASADRYYRFVREGRTIGFLHVSEETADTFEGQAAQVRTTQLAVLATYVGSSEIHSVRETTWVGRGTTSVLGYRVEYRQGRNQESRFTTFRAGRAHLRIDSGTDDPEEREIDVPAGAFVHAGYLSLRDLLAGLDRSGRALQILDPKTIETRVGAVEAPREETLDVLGRPMPCLAYRFVNGDDEFIVWLAAGTKELVRVLEEGPAGVDLVLADERVVAEVQGLDVSAPPLEHRRDLPWTLDEEREYQFLVEGRKSGSVRFTPTSLTIEGRERIAVVATIEIDGGDRRWRSTSATHYDAGTFAPIWFEFNGQEQRGDSSKDVSIKAGFRDGRVGVTYKQTDNQVLENRQSVPPGCQLVHNNNVEQFAVFLSQISLERGETTRMNVFHPRLFKAFVLEIEAGETRTVEGRVLTTAKMKSELLSADLLFDDRGRLLSYGQDSWEFRLVE